MKLLLWVLVLAFALPAALLVAVALGPVTVGVLCAVGFGALVALLAYAFGLAAGAIDYVGSRFNRRMSGS
jgi:ABC-type Na+ efflux pump permease subunit